MVQLLLSLLLHYDSHYLESSLFIGGSKFISNIDKQFYKKYNLKSDEIDYIEKTIKAME